MAEGKVNEDNMKKVILARIGEIALKGLNRCTFEQRLARNMKAALSDCGACSVRWSQSRYFVEPENEDFEFDKALEMLSGVFGLVSISPAYVTDSEYDSISALAKEVAVKAIEKYGKGGKVKFKIETKRGLKSFPMKSPEISAEIGGDLLEAYNKQLVVDVNNPDFILYVEVRENTYIYVRPLRPDARSQYRLERIPGLRRHPRTQSTDPSRRRFCKDRRRLAILKDGIKK